MSSSNVSIGPFSPSLASPLHRSRLSRPLKDLQGHDESTFKMHLLTLEANIKAQLAHKSLNLKQIEDALAELQGLVLEGEEGSVAEELAGVAKQLLFKTAAELLAVRGSKADLSLIPLLCSLSYEAISCVTILDPCISAWSAYLAIDSLTLMQAVPADIEAWDSPTLGERLVSALLPNEKGISRLHSRLFQQARDEAEQLVPEMEELVPRLAEKIIPILGEADVLKLLLLVVSRRNEGTTTFSQVTFFSRLFARLPRTLDPSNNSPLGAQDLAVFLVSLARSIDLRPTTVVPEVLLTVEQRSVWSAVCSVIQDPTKKDDCALALLIGKLLKSVRLKTPTDNIRVLYEVYTWMHRRTFTDDWIQIYAQQIRENIMGLTMLVRNSLIPSNGEQVYSTDEEQKILYAVQMYLVQRALDQGLYRDADNYITEIGDFNKKEIIELRYQLYKDWLPKATGSETAYVQENLTKAEAAFRAISPPPTLAPEGSADSPWPNDHQQQKITRPPHSKGPSTVSSPSSDGAHEEIVIDKEVACSPPSGNSSFASVSTRDCGTSMYFSTSESPFRSDRSLTPTTIHSPSDGPSPQSASPPEEPMHRRVLPNDSPAVPNDTFALQEFEEEESFLMEIICRKMEKTEVAMKQVEKVKHDYAAAAANAEALQDMERRMEEMKSDYENKLKLMKDQLKEQKKAAPKSLVPQLGDPRQILRDKFDAHVIFEGETAHPGHTGFCFGCLPDDEQEKALKILDDISEKWNNEDTD